MSIYVILWVLKINIFLPPTVKDIKSLSLYNRKYDKYWGRYILIYQLAIAVDIKSKLIIIPKLKINLSQKPIYESYMFADKL